MSVRLRAGCWRRPVARCAAGGRSSNIIISVRRERPSSIVAPNQIHLSRRRSRRPHQCGQQPRFFTPRLRFKNFDELNAWLLDKCIAYAKVHPHPELTEQTIWEVFEAERPKLVPYAGRFDGFHAVPASVSKTCLVRFDNNKYSVTASAVGRPVEVHAYADRIVIRGSYPDGDVTDMTLGLFSGFGEGNDRINLSTLHSAKGREFVVVVLFGMDDGRIPRRNTSLGTFERHGRSSMSVSRGRPRGGRRMPTM